MPSGKSGRPQHSPIGNAVRVGRIATGEGGAAPIATGGKNAAAVALGSLGGKARAARMTAAKRSEIASKAARTRWGK